MFLTIIVFLVTLSTLILVHEFGHFLAAKKAGIRVQEFGFGYPPRIFAKKINQTVYSLNWILFGGFVRLCGEELEEAVKEKSKYAFWVKSKKARTVVILSGVLANFLLAIFGFSVVYSVAGIPIKTEQIRIISIVPESPADKMGFKENDLVLKVEGQPLSDLDQFTKLIEEKKGSQVKILVKREKDNPCLKKVLGGGVGFSCQNSNLLFFVTPRSEPPEGEGPLGIVISNIVMKKYPYWQMPARGTIEGLKEAFAWTALIVHSLGKMLVDLLARGVIPREVAGPIGIFQITSAIAQTGILNILQFIGILSVNLAIINILPFPALDGGKLIFVGYELITRRRPKPSLERWVNTAGMTILIFLILLVTINDVLRLVETTNFLSQLRSIWPF